MPLQDGDIELLYNRPIMIKDTAGKLIPARELQFRVRGDSVEKIQIPQSMYSHAYAEQMMMQVAADLIDLADKFPVREG